MLLSFKNSRTIIENPTTIFEIKNFLNTEDFNELQKFFPSSNFFKKNRVSDNAEEKFSSSHKNFNKFINEYPVWKKFYEALNTEEFIKSAFLYSIRPNLKSRGLRALRIWTTKPKAKFLKFFFNHVYTHITITRQKKGQIVFPHKDSPNKLMSLIYYMPDKNWKKTFNGGTEFWKIKKNNLKWKNHEGHVIEEIKKFKNESEIIYKSEFDQNKLIGFTRNDNSWHSVLEIEPTGDVYRKSVNIFIRYKK